MSQHSLVDQVLSRRRVLLGAAAVTVGGLVVAPDGLAHAASGTVNFQFQGQETGWWCSAATARIVLSARNAAVSQTQLAKELDVVNSGLPDINNLVRVLRTRTGASYALRSSSSNYSATLDADVRHNINNGFAVAMNTWYYRKGETMHKSSSGHYLAIVGYDESRYYIADPASRVNGGRWHSKSEVVGWRKNNRWVSLPAGGGSTPPPPTSPWPVLRVGSSGFRVRSLQHLLRHRGHAIATDGSFGAQTDRAVKAFQASAGLAQDGIVAAQTWPRVIVNVSNGASGEAARAAQVALNGNGSSLTVDGKFGSVSTSAARAFQSRNGLTVDGLVGPKTWAALL